MVALDARRKRYLAFFVGLGLLSVAVMLGTTGVRYGMYLDEDADGSSAKLVLQYDTLSENDQETFRHILQGETVEYNSRAQLPGLDTGPMILDYQGESYVIQRSMYFDWTTPSGAVALGIGIVGLVAVVWAVREDVRSAR